MITIQPIIVFNDDQIRVVLHGYSEKALKIVSIVLGITGIVIFAPIAIILNILIKSDNPFDKKGNDPFIFGVIILGQLGLLYIMYSASFEKLLSIRKNKKQKIKFNEFRLTSDKDLTGKLVAITNKFNFNDVPFQYHSHITHKEKDGTLFYDITLKQEIHILMQSINTLKFGDVEYSMSIGYKITNNEPKYYPYKLEFCLNNLEVERIKANESTEEIDYWGQINRLIIYSFIYVLMLLIMLILYLTLK